MKVLVIGGTGFVGSRVVSRLASLGHEVTVFHRGRRTVALPPSVRHVLGDRDRIWESRHELHRLGPDVVLDVVPMAEKAASEVMDMFDGMAGRAVAISSQDVYRAWGRVIGREPGIDPEPVPLSEDSPLRSSLFIHRGTAPRAEDDPARCMDDWEKILVERQYLRSSKLPGTILRLPLVYGPGDQQHRLHEYLKRMDDGRRVIILPETISRWRWTRGFVTNVADAITLAVTNHAAAGRIYNVGEPDALSGEQWVRAIGDAADWRGDIVTVGLEQTPDHLRVAFDSTQDMVTGSSRIRVELGHAEAVSRDRALHETVQWERANPPTKFDASRFNYAAEDALLRHLDI